MEQLLFPQAPLPQTRAQRRFSYLASRRSMAEMERVLHRFLSRELTNMEDAECLRMEAVLQHSDADLLDWMTGIKPVPGDVDGDALARLALYARESFES
ncbi:MAG: succinate dehydrogenase assembly factor 2 [Magnetococcales bacterium]|nr:succinate dehydrogenase assembly factor 2 [Magnetococcales bacterium]